MAVRVLLKLPAQMHMDWKIFLDNPPAGFEYVRDRRDHTTWERSESPILRYAANFSYRDFRLRPVVSFARDSGLLVRERLDNLVHPKSVELVLSVAPFTAFNRVPTILYLEYAAKSGATRDPLYRSILLRTGISKILTYNPTSARTFLSILSEAEFERLVAVVRLGIPLPPTYDKVEGDVVTLLFVGSGNYPKNSLYGYLSFMGRGGLDMLRAFRIINGQYGAKVRLSIFSRVDDNIKREFSDVLSLPNVALREDIIPKAELFKVYWSSDILLFPSFRASQGTIGEALGCRLPVVASDCWDLPDHVSDGVNGFLVHRDARGILDERNHIPFWNIPNAAKTPPDEDFIKGFAEAISKLIDNRAMRTEFGLNGRSEVETGRSSIQVMKKELARHFNEVIRASS